MARSTEAMPKAVYVLGDETRYIEPQEAISIRELGEITGYTLYCENYFKCDCNAKVKAVGRKRNPAFHLKQEEEHCPDCSYHLEIIPIKERIRNIPKNKKAVVQIDESDMFEIKEKKIKTEGDKQRSTKGNRVLEVPEKVITRTVSGTKNTYIRTIADLIELLNSEDDAMIKHTLRQLYTANMFYKRWDYETIWEQQPKNSFIVEGYLDQGTLKLLEEKGYTYAYPEYKKKPNEIRIMLVHQGKGKKRFQKTVKSLIEWISKEADGNRKLALIKGNIVSFYEEKRIIVLHVKDIDIKYRKHGYNAETKLPKKAVKPELSLPKIEKEPLRPVKTEIKLLEQKQQLDIHTDEFLLQFIDNQQLQNMKQMDVPPIPLKQWFSAEDTSTYTLVPIDKFMGVENSRRREGKWLNQLYRLDRSTQNLQRIQIDGIEKFKNLVLRESDITFNYYEDLDVYYVDDGGTHRSVIAKILNIDYVMAKIWVYKSNGKLEKEQQLFRKHLYQLENSIREMGFVPTYDSAKQSISICSNDNQLVIILENLVYPTFYQEGKDTFPYWISMFRELKVEGEKLNTKPHFLRKWILYYKKKKNAYLHEEYYYQMLRMYTLTNK